MKAFEDIVIGKSSIPALGITVFLMLALPVCFFLYWLKSHKAQTKITWLIAGAAGFLISARVLELGVHYVCITADNPVSRFINGNTAAFVLYGIGHGGIEVLSVLLPAMILYLAIAVLFSRGDTESALKALNITEETAAAALPSVQAAAAFDYGMMAMNVIERVFAMLLHIGLSVIVCYGVVRGKKGALPTAILLHMLMDTFPALYQRGLVPLWAAEVWGAFWAAAVTYLAAKLYKKI